MPPGLPPATRSRRAAERSIPAAPRADATLRRACPRRPARQPRARGWRVATRSSRALSTRSSLVGIQRPHHHPVCLAIRTEHEGLLTGTHEPAFLVEGNRPRITLPDTEPDRPGTRFTSRGECGMHQHARHASAMVCPRYIEPLELDRLQIRYALRRRAGNEVRIADQLPGSGHALVFDEQDDAGRIGDLLFLALRRKRLGDVGRNVVCGVVRFERVAEGRRAELTEARSVLDG